MLIESLSLTYIEYIDVNKIDVNKIGVVRCCWMLIDVDTNLIVHHISTSVAILAATEKRGPPDEGKTGFRLRGSPVAS